MFWIIPLVAFLASILTFFSGFGLGTLLLAAMVWYYPPELAIALTGFVHLINSALKSALNRSINWKIVLIFGIPSFLAAIIGSILLSMLSNNSMMLYDLSETDITRPVSLLALLIGFFMISFSILELSLKGKSLSLPLWLGGAISGFMGGLSGHQGALRSVFLLNRVGEASAFVSTAAFIGLMTDLSRNSMYLVRLNWDTVDLTQLVFTVIAAAAGVVIGTRLLKKISFGFIQTLVSIGVFMLGSAIITGLI
ncbi:MAG: TSUP family transporter [Flavobacteriales bacterium]